MSTKIGKAAENAAAEWLKYNKFQIITQNWRNRWCEIDIIAKKGKEIHFVEVKYRKSPVFGAGFDYITQDKINRLKRAAQAWMQENSGINICFHIDVMAVGGRTKPFSIEYLADAIAD